MGLLITASCNRVRLCDMAHETLQHEARGREAAKSGLKGGPGLAAIICPQYFRLPNCSRWTGFDQDPCCMLESIVCTTHSTDTMLPANLHIQ